MVDQGKQPRSYCVYHIIISIFQKRQFPLQMFVSCGVVGGGGWAGDGAVLLLTVYLRWLYGHNK